jgi:probable rRNA maturation factor
MIYFDINELYLGKFDAELLRGAAENALLFKKASANIELTIAIETSDKLHELNKQFLGIDAPTDVLSFAAYEKVPETDCMYLGDIIISYPLAETQAKTSGHSIIAELQLLVIHGTLHLLGDDHATLAQKTKMWKAQKDILERIHCPLEIYPD